MNNINPEHISAVLAIINHSPYFVLLGLQVTDLGAGYARAELVVKKQHQNPFGTVHGGVYATLVDTAAYWAAYCEIAENDGFTTIDVNVNDLAMAKEGTLYVEGKSLKVGSSISLCEATVWDDRGAKVAYGTSKLLMLEGRQTISEAAINSKDVQLPSKFKQVQT